MKRLMTTIATTLLLALILTSCNASKSSDVSLNDVAVPTLASQQTDNNSTPPTNTPPALAVDVSASTQITGSLTVKYLDVGQGDSILIQTPGGKVILIDAGPASAGNTIPSALKSLNINTIDVLVATHPHEDHIGGMTDVVNNFNIGSIYMPKVSATTKVYQYLLTAINNKGLKVNTAKVGVEINIDPALSIVMLAPNTSSYADLNDYSAVIKITYKNTSFLFAGDASNVSEAEMLSGGNLKADVLKVGHHGSATSSSNAFLDKVSPKYAVISVGAGNSYGHPTFEALNRLATHNINVYRTDESGTVTATSDGYNITLDKSASPIKTNAPPAAKVVPPANNVVPPVNNIAPPANDNSGSASVTVYATKTGSKYHMDGCSYLAKSKMPMTLSEAKAKGLTPCSKCHPPS